VLFRSWCDGSLIKFDTVCDCGLVLADVLYALSGEA
jgi:hypothetical protein